MQIENLFPEYMLNQREASSHYKYPKIVSNNYLFINMTRRGKKLPSRIFFNLSPQVSKL